MKNNNYASFFKTKPKKVERYIRFSQSRGSHNLWRQKKLLNYIVNCAMES